jgi:hypothetical protein
MQVILRKSSNTNNFGQREYMLVDTTARQLFTVVATNNWQVGDTVHRAGLGEHRVVSRGTIYSIDNDWLKFLGKLVCDFPPSRGALELYARLTLKCELPVVKRVHPRKSQRMSPARLELVELLRKRRGYNGGRDGSSCLDYDVSIYCRLDYDSLLALFRKQAPLALWCRGEENLAKYMPEDSEVWQDIEQEWHDYLEHTEVCILDDIRETLECDVDYYSINPVTSVKHDVEVKLLGRGGKHLVVTKFDGLPTPWDLLSNIMEEDRTSTDKHGVPYIKQFGYDSRSHEYTHEWMRNFATMVKYWDSLDIKNLVRDEYQRRVHDAFELLVIHYLDEIMEADEKNKQLAPWFTVVTN